MAEYRSVQWMDSATAAYIAGLVDGEGTITLSAEHRGERRRLVVSISNTDRSLLEFVLANVGAGRITCKKTYSARHTPSFAYKITSRQAIHFLAQIHPFLRTYRKTRARIALDRYVPLTPRNGKYAAELLALRDAFERELLAIGPGPHSRFIARTAPAKRSSAPCSS